MANIKTCIFPVAGLGSRFLPATKSVPKEMLVVVDKPLIQYAVEEAKAAGIQRFIFVTSQGKTAIEDHFDSSPLLEETLNKRQKYTELESLNNIRLEPGQAIYLRQHAPLGLGHAVLCARHLVNEDAFALILADDLVLSEQPCLKQMIESFDLLKGNMVGVMDVEPIHTNRYGILDVIQDDGKQVKARAVIEKPKIEEAPSTVAVMGRYILNSKIFNYLENQVPGSGGEIQLTDAIQSMIKDVPLNGFRYKGQRFDCGTKEGWLEANLAYAYMNPQLRQGIQKALEKYPLLTQKVN